MNTTDTGNAPRPGLVPCRYNNYVPPELQISSTPSLDEAGKYIGALGVIQKWISIEGVALLKKQAMTWQEVNQFLDYAFALWARVPNNRIVNGVCSQVIGRSIDSLSIDIASKKNELADMNTSERVKIYHAWIYLILSRLHHHEYFGVGGRACPEEVSRMLLQKMAQVALLLQCDMLLEGVATDMYPGDRPAQIWFVSAMKNRPN